MKVHQFARGPWDHEPSLTLGCSKRLRPLAPKLASPNQHDATAVTTAAFDLKSFIRPESGPRKLGSFDDRRPDSAQVVETHPGGTRWNPTQEQIGILEMLYRGGMRTPSTPQIDEITKQLGKYGKIEGKNVFYWFQNHKARERQKQKRSSLSLGHSPRTPSPPLNTTPNIHLDIMQQQGEQRVEREEDSPYKRKCRSWGFESSENNSRSCVEAEEEEEEEDLGDKTLELFPLHPECGPRR